MWACGEPLGRCGLVQGEGAAGLLAALCPTRGSLRQIPRQAVLQDCTASNALALPTATKGPGDTCGPEQFVCVSTHTCIPAGYQCDNETDCPDRSDEIGCSEWGRVLWGGEHGKVKRVRGTSQDPSSETAHR